ncbi:MAG: capsule assembly Wzi family protein [Ignavibacteria bacterium]|jgi:hypothetical protein|nr:capsule assembly Wzi family protein [Ignavibacteria bacterium]
MIKKILIFLIFTFFSAGIIFAQVEYAPVNHPVYEFLKRMSLKDFIKDYNSASLPLSRDKISRYLMEAELNKSRMSSVDKKILQDYYAEFSYDINRNLSGSYSLFSDLKSFDVFNDKKQKYLYAFADSNASLFWDITGNAYQITSAGDSLGDHNITLGELGTRIRGTLFNSVGYYLRMSNGQKIAGDQSDVDFSVQVVPKLKANTKYLYEENNFDTYEGYIRYATNNEWLSLVAGKEAMTYGFGYIDKLFMSNNTVPFSFIKLDLEYKALKYSFLYGSLKGDSLGIDIQYKNIATHRLDIGISNSVRFGFWESIITSDDAFNFTYINPLSFLRSADYNAGENQSGNKNNALMGFDIEVIPVKNLSAQATLLIDDLNFSSLFSNEKNGQVANDNRFGYQLGIMWSDAFTLPNLTGIVEYTRLDPFVYTHRTNKSQYTNWGLPLGHNLPPNSDEIAVKFKSNIYSRLDATITYRHQRSGNEVVLNGDTLVYNAGGDINRGDGDVVTENEFLQGDRTDRDIVQLDLIWQPLRQYYLIFSYKYLNYNLLYNSTKKSDNIFFGTVKIDF